MITLTVKADGASVMPVVQLPVPPQLLRQLPPQPLRQLHEHAEM